MNKEVFQRDRLNNIRIHVLPTDRFKTYAISVYVGCPLSERTVTPTALIPFVLRRGTNRLPETKQFRQKLDDLYGAGFGFDVYKRGDYQIVQFRMDVIHDQFITESISLIQEAMSFIGEAVADPASDNGIMRNTYVEAEKNTLKTRLEAIVNDKIKYAADRCIEEMCKGEPFRLNALGRVEDIAQITPEDLTAHHQSWLVQSPIDIYVVGKTTLDEVKSFVEQAFQLSRTNASTYEHKNTFAHVNQVNTVIDELDVSQGKLNMGLRTHVVYADDRYPAGLMYNGILGGYPHSKLFMNVREKESLAYYASSHLDGHKGIMTIQTGIEVENYEKAVRIIKQQLADMADGTISDVEIQQTRAMITNQLREILDSAFQLIAFDFNNILSQKERTVPELIQAIETAEVSAIQQFAQQVELDTIYFLRGQKGD